MLSILLQSTRPRAAGLFTAGSMMLALSACASLPSSGPTARDVVRGAQDDHSKLAMQLVDIDPAVVDHEQSGVMSGHSLATLDASSSMTSNNVVGPGDQLDIALFEVGVPLFGASRSSPGEVSGSSQVQRFPTITVGQSGTIRLPYAGTIAVVGRTPAEIAEAIERAYRGKSQSPQVLVTIRGNLSDTVIVSGDVRKSGRVELTAQRERLLDAIATAGGSVAQTQDMVVRVTRAGRQAEERLDRVRAGSPDDLILAPGDRIELIRQQQTFVVLGASSRVSQISFDQSNLTLAEAVARAGGPNDTAADPRSVFLFRYTASPEPGQPPRPTIFRLNLIDPASYFLAQRFAMRDKDVLYISNAATNRPAKLVSIINQLFSPFIAARALAGN
jgi:polysaccharide export outer membrane protein